MIIAKYSEFLFCKPVYNEHTIYIGLIEIDHIENQLTASIKVKVFQDDLQDILRHAYGLKKAVKDTDFCIINRSEIEKYFQQHLQFIVNQENENLKFEYGTAQNDVYILNFEIDCPKTWTTFDIKADFFMELFAAQSNIIQLKDGSKRRFGRLKKGDIKAYFELN